MKLTADLDMPKRRDDAARQVNMAFRAREDAIDMSPRIHAAKASYARQYKANGTTHGAIAAEALHRGLTIDALCDLILRREAEAQSKLLLLDGARQTILRAIEAAKSPQDIATALSAL